MLVLRIWRRCPSQGWLSGCLCGCFPPLWSLPYRLLVHQSLHLNNVMLIQRWTSPLRRLLLRPPLPLRLVKALIRITRWLRRRRGRPRRRSPLKESLHTQSPSQVQLSTPVHLKSGHLLPLHGRSSFLVDLCKEDHLLRDCPGIPRVLEVWSHDPARPSSSTDDHGDATSSVGNGKEKGKIRIPCRLCEGKHPLHLCPLMDKACAVLESLAAPPNPFPAGYQRLSTTVDRTPADKEIASDCSLVQAPLPEPGCSQPVPDPPLVGKGVDSSSSPLNHSVSKEKSSHVLLVSSDSPEFDKGSLKPLRRI